MSREIKFEYGFQSQNGIVKKVYELSQIPRIAQICDVWNELPICYVRQYTGLKGVGNVELFEGDIDQYGWVIKFFSGSFIIEKDGSGLWEYLSDEAATFEVIGNIHTPSQKQ